MAAQNWQYAPLTGTAASPAYGGGASGMLFHDNLDMRRSMQGARTPEAQYPDGYLGTVPSRRGDRLLDAVKTRVTQKNYQRGVHKGERIDPGDYEWTRDFNPQTGIALQAQAVYDGQQWQTPRFTPTQTINERLIGDARQPVPQGGVDLLQGRPTSGIVDPKRRSQLGNLLPRWQ